MVQVIELPKSIACKCRLIAKSGKRACSPLTHGKGNVLSCLRTGNPPQKDRKDSILPPRSFTSSIIFIAAKWSKPGSSPHSFKIVIPAWRTSRTKVRSFVRLCVRTKRKRKRKKKRKEEKQGFVENWEVEDERRGIRFVIPTSKGASASITIVINYYYS